MSTLRKPMTPPTKIALYFRIGKCFFKIGRYNSLPILFIPGPTFLTPILVLTTKLSVATNASPYLTTKYFSLIRNRASIMLLIL